MQTGELVLRRKRVTQQFDCFLSASLWERALLRRTLSPLRSDQAPLHRTRRVSAHAGHDHIAKLAKAVGRDREGAGAPASARSVRLQVDALLHRDIAALTIGRRSGQWASAPEGAVGRRKNRLSPPRAEPPDFSPVRPMTGSAPYRERAYAPSFRPEDVWARPSDQRKKASPTAGF